MTWLLLIVVPLVGACTLLVPALGRRASLVLVGTAVVTAVIAVVHAVSVDTRVLLDGYIHGDATAQLFVPVIDVIFVGISGYIRTRVASAPERQQPIRGFSALALGFLATANLALLANHLLVMWIALEVTTLLAAPLIVRPDAISSRLASWRYLAFSSIGLALVLLGLSCLTRSMAADHQTPTLFLDAMPAVLTGPANAWRQVGVGLVLLGICTKLGLAPMYSWLPETYDEAPESVTALLATVQFNCTLVFLFRVIHIYRPGSGGLITGELLTIGLMSMGVSTASLIATRSIKRLLAYGAINHAGVIAIGLGLGTTAAYGLLLYVVSNAFIKAILFLTAGKIEMHYGTKDTRVISGLIKDLPYSGLFLMVGTFALLGFPPFGSFLGELLILSALVTNGQIFVFAAFCVLITVSFVATGRTIFPMIWGKPTERHTWPRQSAWQALPKLIFLALLIVLGIYIPPAINVLMAEVAVMVGGT